MANPCQDNLCDQLCLLSPNPKGFVCKCRLIFNSTYTAARNVLLRNGYGSPKCANQKEKYLLSLYFCSMLHNFVCWKVTCLNQCCGSVNIYFGAVIPIYRSGYGSRRPVNYGFGRVGILSGHFCAKWKQLCCHHWNDKILNFFLKFLPTSFNSKEPEPESVSKPDPVPKPDPDP